MLEMFKFCSSPCEKDLTVEFVQTPAEGNGSCARKKWVQINVGPELTLTSCVTNAVPRGLLAGSVWALMSG